jgi:hypothetical protein
MARVDQQETGGLGRPCAIGVGGDAGQVSAAGAVLDDDQGEDAPQQYGVHLDEADREDRSGLGGQELLPGRPGASWPMGSPCSVTSLDR